jgi:hypothetical protein
MRARGAAAALCAVLLVVSGCSQERGDAGPGSSTGPTGNAGLGGDADVVLRAELRAGSTGEQAGELVTDYIQLDGVTATRGDGGTHVLVFLDPEASEDVLRDVEERLESEEVVERVTVQRP